MWIYDIGEYSIVTLFHFPTGASYSCCLGSRGLADLTILLVWCILPLDFSMGEGRCFTIRLISMFSHITKYHFLMDWKRVWFKGLNNVAWYDLTTPGFVLFAIAFNIEGLGGVDGGGDLEARLTCHITEVPFKWPSITVVTCSSTLRWVYVKVSVQPSSQNFPMEMRYTE